MYKVVSSVAECVGNVLFKKKRIIATFFRVAHKKNIMPQDIKNSTLTMKRMAFRCGQNSVIKKIFQINVFYSKNKKIRPIFIKCCQNVLNLRSEIKKQHSK